MIRVPFEGLVDETGLGEGEELGAGVVEIEVQEARTVPSAQHELLNIES